MHGSAEATEHLKQHCLKTVCQHVYAPQTEESIDVTSDLCAYKVNFTYNTFLWDLIFTDTTICLGNLRVVVFSYFVTGSTF